MAPTRTEAVLSHTEGLELRLMGGEMPGRPSRGVHYVSVNRAGYFSEIRRGTSHLELQRTMQYPGFSKDPSKTLSQSLLSL